MTTLLTSEYIDLIPGLQPGQDFVFTLNKSLMNKRIKGNNDGPNGRNESYNWNGKNYNRPEMVKRVEKGLHPENTVVKINGRKYVKDKPDSSKKDNVNR